MSTLCKKVKLQTKSNLFNDDLRRVNKRYNVFILKSIILA